MRVGFDRAQIIDRDDLDIGTTGLDDRAQDVAADAAKSVDGDFGAHWDALTGSERRFCRVPLPLTNRRARSCQAMLRNHQRAEEPVKAQNQRMFLVLTG
jgi:hypothetical protein